MIATKNSNVHANVRFSPTWFGTRVLFPKGSLLYLIKKKVLFSFLIQNVDDKQVIRDIQYHSSYQWTYKENTYVQYYELEDKVAEHLGPSQTEPNKHDK